MPRILVSSRKIDLRQQRDYKKAEPEILKLADYLLRTPTKPHVRIDKSFALESNRGRAHIYMDYWLSGPKEELIDGTSFKL